jgi:hypothetical protein
VSNVIEWPYQVVGARYGVLGVGFTVYRHVRVRAIESAVDRGEFARLDVWDGQVQLVAGVLVGFATIALVVLTV